MLYIKPVDLAIFIPGIKIPKNAVYVRVTLGGTVWRANKPMFYKDIESDKTLKEALDNNKLMIIKK